MNIRPSRGHRGGRERDREVVAERESQGLSITIEEPVEDGL
jgi:hypothetical protein